MSDRGFTLLEVLVATTLLFVALASLAGLSVMATQANARAKSTSFAALLAARKIEELRALPWGYDASGNPRSDAGLAVSPTDALVQNTSGYCDFLDVRGGLLGGGASPPAATVFVRRWSIQPLPSNPGNALVIQVAVGRLRAGASGAGVVVTDDAAMTTVRTRTGT